MVKVVWKAKVSKMAPIEIILPHEDILTRLSTGELEYKYEHKRMTVTVIFQKGEVNDFHPKGVRKAVAVVGPNYDYNAVDQSAHQQPETIHVNRESEIDDGSPQTMGLISQETRNDVEPSRAAEIDFRAESPVYLGSSASHDSTGGDLRTQNLNVRRGPVMFPNARDFEIHGGNFNNVAGDQHNHYTVSSNDEYLEELDPKYLIDNPQRCLEGTRNDIISEIIDWASDFSLPNILWLHSHPGAGKTTIALTVAKKLNEDHRLGTIFAFDAKEGTKLTTFLRLVPYELVRGFPICEDVVISKLKSGVIKLRNATAAEIFCHLVDAPLRRLAESLPANHQNRLPVFIIDGLEECGSLDGPHSSDRENLYLCIKAWATLPTLFKLILTSRAHDDIEALLMGIPYRPLRIGMGDDISVESLSDIRFYLRARFGWIARQFGLPADWPGDDVVEDLAKRAAGNFTWATTMLEYIKISPRERLEYLQRHGSLPAGDVYALYMQIAEKSFKGWGPPELGWLRQVVTVIAATQLCLTPSDIEHALGCRMVSRICNGLRPVLQDGSSLRFAHQSFVDFVNGDPETRDPLVLCPEYIRVDPDIVYHLLSTFRDFFETNFSKLGKLEDLSNLIAAEQQILNLIPADDPIAYSELGGFLRMRYEISGGMHGGDIEDIQQAIITFQKAVDLSFDYDGNLPWRLDQLAGCLKARFLRFGSPDDINKAAIVLHRAVDLTYEDDPDLQAYLSNLGQVLQLRFEFHNDPNILDEAITLLRKANALTRDDHANKPIHLRNIGIALLTRFERLGELIDLEDGVAAHHRVNELTRDDHPEKASFLALLGQALGTRFQRFGKLPDIENALIAQRRANDLAPKDKPSPLYGLGILLGNRYERLGELGDIEQAIALLHRANDLVQDDGIEKPGYLNSLGYFLSCRFKRLGELEDLESAVATLRRADELTRGDHVDKAFYMRTLGDALVTRFEHLGALDDLENAISIHRRARDVTPGDDPRLASCSGSLGNALRARFDCLGHLTDIEEAIPLLRNAAAAISDDNPSKAFYLDHLGVAFRSRFVHLHDAQDIEDAISSLRRACDLTPDHHTDMALYLNDLGQALHLRFEHSGKTKDIDEAISVLRRAAEVTPDDHFKKRIYIETLKTALDVSTKDCKDLELDAAAL